jgi:bifunctional DNase/RNase
VDAEEPFPVRPPGGVRAAADPTLSEALGGDRSADAAMFRLLPSAGMLALSIAFAASRVALLGAAAAPGAAGAAAPPADARVELEIAGVLPMPESGSCIVVLREKGTRTILPLLVPGSDGKDLAPRVRDRAQGLLGQTIAALGARVREVEIATGDEAPSGARVRLSQGPKLVELSARTSESVALAVAAGAPIVTTRRVLEQSGLTPNDLARAKQRLGSGRSRDVRL